VLRLNKIVEKVTDRVGLLQFVSLLGERLFSHFLVLCHALGEDLFFNQHIFEAGVIFNEVVVALDIAIEDLCGGPDASAYHVIIVLAEFDVGFLLADGVLRHLQGVPQRNAIGEEVTALGLGDIAQGVVGRTVVEAGVVGDNCLDVVLLAEVGHVALSGVDGNNLALTCGDLSFVHGALFGVVRRIEELTVGTEHVIDNEAESLVDVALAVMDTAAQVVHHGIVKAVSGLRVDGQIIILALVDSHR